MAQQIKKKFISTNAVDGDKIKLGFGQILKGTDAQGNEIDLLAELSDSINVVAGDLTQEEIRATAVEAILQESIADEGRRASAEEVLIRSEFAAADLLKLQESKDYADMKVGLIASNLDTVALDSLVEVVTAFESADQNLNNAISNLATQLDTRVDGVDLSVSSLEVRMLSAEGSLSNEVSRATSEENALKLRATTSEQDVDSLEIRMMSAEGNISNEVSRATSEENALKLRATASEQDVDSLEIRMMSAEGNISSEVSRATSEENALKLRVTTSEQDVDSLEIRMMSAEGNISSEVSRATSEENALKLRVTTSEQDVDSLEVRMMSAEGNISSEVSRATSEENGIKAGAGLSPDGSYVPNEEVGFIDEATSLYEADGILAQTLGIFQSDFQYSMNMMADAANTEVVNRIAGDASTLSESKSYTDSQIASIPAVDLSGYYDKTQADAKIVEFLVPYATSANVSAQVLAQEAYTDEVKGILESSINVEKARIDAVLLASDADKDSFAEIVQLINSVDTENDSAFASYVLSNNSALAQETQDRLEDLADEAQMRQDADTQLENSIIAEEDRAEAAEGLIQSSLDAYVLQNDININSIHEQMQINDDRALGAEEGIQSLLDGEIERAQAAELVLTTADSSIRSDFAAADSSIRSDFAAQDTAIRGEFASADSSIRSDFAAVDSAIRGEFAAADSQLALDFAAADTAKLVEAKAYADAQDLVVITSSMASDTLIRSEFAAADSALQDSIDDLDGYAQDIRSDVDDLDGYAQDIRSDLDSEMSRVSTVEQGFDSRLDALEAQTDGPFFHKMKIEVSTNLAYVELAHEAISNSIVVSVGRLMAHKDEDFTVSVVGGVTHLTWIGSMVSPDGAEAIESGDKVFVTYAY